MEQAPLMEVRSSTLRTGKLTTLKVFEDAIWVHQFKSPIDVRRQRVLYGQIAQLWTQRRTLFSTLVIETRGGDTLKVAGLSYVTAKTASLFIEQRLCHSDPLLPSEGESRPHTTQETARPGPYEQIQRIARLRTQRIVRLRDEGFISSQEYEGKKRNLPDRT
jgi:hypothetical protein